ncbi:MAG: hypothetical protein HZB16_22485 [Armatimonadetes bacterium]|nr:hypothetical protein [Armatimonadota bacterium]
MQRRTFLGATASAAALGAVKMPSAAAAGAPIPLIHQTDLFRPHGDPDDHFDLAAVYGLATLGAVDLLGVLCDFPPPRRTGDPDTVAVAMLNHLTGLAVPLVVGMPQRPESRVDDQAKAAPSDLTGVNWLLRTLRQSPQPVAISMVGSCKDVAVASRREPELFREKCRAIYLNSGTGAPDLPLDSRREFNVELNPGSYAAIWDIPCPIYWLPCYDHLDHGQPDPRVVMRYASYFQFPMSQILPELAPPMQRYFLSMLEQDLTTHWLKSLRAPVDSAKLATWGTKPRNMWGTATFLHLAGLTVNADGQLIPADQPGVYVFKPITATCTDDGHTQWRDGAGTPARYKFEIVDEAHYAVAMTKALLALIKPLGQTYVATPGK